MGHNNMIALAHNQKTDDGADTATQLQTEGVPDGYTVAVKALNTNTEAVFVGDSSVTLTNGFPLNKSDGVTLAVTNVDKIWIRSSGGGQKVAWLVEVMH